MNAEVMDATPLDDLDTLLGPTEEIRAAAENVTNE